MSPKRLESVSSRVGEKYVLGEERSSRSSAAPLTRGRRTERRYPEERGPILVRT